MIRSNNPRIDVEALRGRVAEEVRQMSAPESSPRLTRLALEMQLQAIEQALAAAEERSAPRTSWPENLQMFPFSASRRLREFALRVLGLAMRDQQEVNAALIRSQRETITLLRTLLAENAGEQKDEPG
jgi:hypothetical protein